MNCSIALLLARLVCITACLGRVRTPKGVGRKPSLECAHHLRGQRSACVSALREHQLYTTAAAATAANT